MAIVAPGAAFAGPVTAWLVMGVGLFVALVGNAVATAWRQRVS